MATLVDLARRMEALADSVERIKYETMARYILAIVKTLLPATPVDTSEALSNWQVGRSAGPAIGPHVPGVLGSTESASTAIAIRNAEAAIRANRYADALVIFNAAGHIRALDEGSSRQAPAGFIAKAVLAGKLAARRSN